MGNYAQSVQHLTLEAGRAHQRLDAQWKVVSEECNRLDALRRDADSTQKQLVALRQTVEQVQRYAGRSEERIRALEIWHDRLRDYASMPWWRRVAMRLHGRKPLYFPVYLYGGPGK